jgi:hypothetical protein
MLELKSLQESIMKQQQALLNSSLTSQSQSTNANSSFIPNLFNSIISNQSFKQFNLPYHSYYNQQNESDSNSLSNYKNFTTEKTIRKRSLDDEDEDYKDDLKNTKTCENLQTKRKKMSSFLISDILDLENAHKTKKLGVENEEEENIQSYATPQNEKTYTDHLNVEMYQTQAHRYVSNLPVDYYRIFMSLLNQKGINSTNLYNQNTRDNSLMDFSLKLNNKIGAFAYPELNGSDKGGCSNKPFKYEEISLSSATSSSPFSSSSFFPDDEKKLIQQEITPNRKSNSNGSQSTISTQSILSSLELLAKNQFPEKQNFASIERNVMRNSRGSSEEQVTLLSSKKQFQVGLEAGNKQKSTHKESSENVKTIKNESKNNTNKTDSTNSSLPAWIFCTRYSDRPSAGKTLVFNKRVIKTRDM